MPNNPITGVTPYEVFRISFWMKKFGHATLKRTTVVSNSRAIYAFDQGPLTSEEKHCEYVTVETYVDAKGRKRWKGSSLLKQTQFLSKTLV